MKIDRAGFPFIAAALLPAVGLAASRRRGWAVPFAALAGFFAYFFRDPDRDVPDDPGLVVSPADGRRNGSRKRPLHYHSGTLSKVEGRPAGARFRPEAAFGGLAAHQV